MDTPLNPNLPLCVTATSNHTSFRVNSGFAPGKVKNVARWAYNVSSPAHRDGQTDIVPMDLIQKFLKYVFFWKLFMTIHISNCYLFIHHYMTMQDSTSLTICLQIYRPVYRQLYTLWMAKFIGTLGFFLPLSDAYRPRFVNGT